MLVKKIFKIIIIILFFLSIGLLSSFNYKNDDFFKMNLYQIVSLSFVVFVSYYLTQKKLDSRKQRDVLNDLITEIIDCSFKLTLEAVLSEKSKLFMMELRNIENRLSLLEKVSGEYGIKIEINYLKSQNTAMLNLVSNHLDDNDTLEKIFVDIEKHINNLQNKCKEVQFIIYFE